MELDLVISFHLASSLSLSEHVESISPCCRLGDAGPAKRRLVSRARTCPQSLLRPKALVVMHRPFERGAALFWLPRRLRKILFPSRAVQVRMPCVTQMQKCGDVGVGLRPSVLSAARLLEKPRWRLSPGGASHSRNLAVRRCHPVLLAGHLPRCGNSACATCCNRLHLFRRSLSGIPFSWHPSCAQTCGHCNCQAFGACYTARQVPCSKWQVSLPVLGSSLSSS